MRIAGTGHRPDKLGGYGDDVWKRLVAFAERALSVGGSNSLVISGMALGWDQALAQAALNRDQEFHAYLPCYNPHRKWPFESRERFERILAYARRVIVACPGEYRGPECMFIRNNYMVEDCTDVLALWNGSEGGTSHCVKFAKKTRPVKRVINVWDDWVKFNEEIGVSKN